MTAPPWSTVTLSPMPPAPAWPPTVCDEPCALLPLVPATEIENAPLPPPPPTDCAKIALALPPAVWMLPTLVTVTAPPLPPPAPLPPTELLVTPPLLENAPATEKPPLPPPPPIDCARMPTAPSPCVTTLLPDCIVTLTIPAVLPLPPAPPTAFAAPLPCVDKDAPTVNPPLPPPAPIDCD